MPALTVRTAGSNAPLRRAMTWSSDVTCKPTFAWPIHWCRGCTWFCASTAAGGVAIDNGSLNGMFVDRRRVSSVDISDGQSINISNPDGPRLTFEVGRRMGPVGRPPSGPKHVRPPSGPQPVLPLAQQYVSQPASQSNYRTPTEMRPSVRRSGGDGSKLAIERDPNPARPRRHRRRAPSRSAAPPTTTSCIRDVLASRHHATLCPPRGRRDRGRAQHQRDIRQRHPRRWALLREDDLVTIGNVDLVFHGALVRRTENRANIRRGGCRFER